MHASLRTGPKFIVATVAMMLVSFLQPLFAQSNANISGYIKNEKGAGLPFISVALFRLNDSSFVKAAVTAENGKFQIEKVAPGVYYLLARSMGYKTAYSNNVNVGTEQLISVEIQMQQEEHMIQEVVVSSRKPSIEMRADRTILNVAASINATGTNALEILRKSPGVRVLGDDDILINGKRGLSVYLDGNRINLGGKELADLLKNMQSSDIEAIEVITNPSARYDAAGQAGVINIRTKRNDKKGFNGNVALTAATSRYYPKYDGGIGLNYRNKAISLFGNYNYANGQTLNKTEYFRKQVTPDNLLTNFDQYFSNKSHNTGHTFKAGVNITASPTSNFQVMVDGSIPTKDGMSNSNTLIYHTPGNIDSVLKASNDQYRKSNMLNYNASYRYADSFSRELTINANYLDFNLHADSYQPNYYYDSKDVFLRSNIYSNKSVSGISVKSLKADYSQKLLGGRFSTGLKYTDTKSDNDFVFYNVLNNSNIPDTGKTNQFIYNEKIVAGYIDYNMNWKAWEVQLGLRGEYTTSSGILKDLIKEELDAVKNNYMSYFPNAVITYKWNKNNATSIVYNKRIDRPAYQDLNPFVYVQDEYSFTKGNPFLLPEYTSTFKLSNNYKQMLTTSFSYADTKNYIVRYRDSIMGGRTFQTNVNIAHQKNYTLAVFFQLSPKKWWDFNYGLNAFHQEVKGMAGASPVNMSQNAWSFTGSNTFMIPDGWSAELSFYYNSKYLDVPAIVDPQWSVDVGLQKKILHNAGTLRFAVSDIFNTLDLSLTRDFGGLYYTNRIKWESQQFKISFNYRFGNTKLKSAGTNEGGMKEEKKRMR
ncbi:outer membrane beta-barrel protein [Chitinophaga sp. Hz27]|uniref:outer membrane beta-barrel protein n=1 Tax=Chitinophaga sp. Hz27 TaxID=3347169 RepID=UPI0035D9A7AB